LRVGVPTEVKPDEYRVALTPAGVRELVDGGHGVVVQAGAGLGSAISDEAYTAQGASINVIGGQVTYTPVAEAVGVQHVPVDEALAGVAAGAV
jgi:alanine dehydrogenase